MSPVRTCWDGGLEPGELKFHSAPRRGDNAKTANGGGGKSGAAAEERWNNPAQ